MIALRTMRLTRPLSNQPRADLGHSQCTTPITVPALTGFAKEPANFIGQSIIPSLVRIIDLPPWRCRILLGRRWAESFLEVRGIVV